MEYIISTACSESPDALNGIEDLLAKGIELAGRNRLSEAMALFQRAVEIEPNSAPARLNLGVAFAQCGRNAEAISCLEEALRKRPDYAEASYNLANVLSAIGRKQEALAVYESALTRRADHFGVLNNLGLLLQEMGRPAEATVLLKQAVRVRPNVPEAHNNLGLALADLGRLDEGEACFGRALSLKPLYSDGHANLAGVLREGGRHDEALASFDMAIRIDPESKSARYNRSLCLLQMGRWEEGFREYEFRFERRRLPRSEFSAPQWGGELLFGKVVLVHTEQGLGDAIQFARYVAMLQERGARTLVECPVYLAPLLTRCAGVDSVVQEGAARPAYDYHVPLMSLPAAFGTTTENALRETPYFAVDADRVERWRGWLGPGDGFRVGIAWQGNPYFHGDRWRSAPLRHFLGLAEVGGLELVSLQHTHGLDQLRQLPPGTSLRVPDDNLDQDGPFLDTAALIRCLDLVVCVDSAVGHLAGALGVPVWLALSASPDWRWLLGRDDSPWYPNHRLFRQRKLGVWGDVFSAIGKHLEGLVARRIGGGVAKVRVAAGELLDRLTILRIKSERVTDSAGKRHARAEIVDIENTVEATLSLPDHVDKLVGTLQSINGQLWDVEDALRDCERRGDFGDRFVELARNVYKLNDRRAEVKRTINTALNAPWFDYKQYGSAKELTA